MTSVDVEAVRTWCAAHPAAQLEHPFGPEAAVFKVGGKIFAIASETGPPDYVTLKALPDERAARRAEHPFIREGYYMNKRHWITVDLGPEVPRTLVRHLIEDSYELVAAALPRRTREELGLSPPRR